MQLNVMNARAVALILRAGALVISLQNGVDNVALMRASGSLDPGATRPETLTRRTVFMN